MIRLSKSIRHTVFCFMLAPSAIFAQAAEDICTRGSGVFYGAPFEVTYSFPVLRPGKKEELPASDGIFPNKSITSSGGIKCSGGGIVGAINCVTQQMEAALNATSEAATAPAETAANATVEAENVKTLPDNNPADDIPEDSEDVIRITMTFNPVFIPGDPSTIQLRPAGPARIVRPEVFSNEDAKRVSKSVAAQNRSIKDWKPELSKDQNVAVYRGNPIGVDLPVTAPGVKREGEAPNLRMPAECSSLYRTYSELAKLYDGRAKSAARLKRYEKLLKAERKKAGFTGNFWDTDYVDRIERSIAREKRNLTAYDIEIKEKSGYIKNREKRLSSDDHDRETAAIKSDPDKLKAEKERRRQAMMDAGRDTARFKWQIVEGEQGYARSLSAYDALIKRAKDNGNDDYAEALEKDKARLKQTRDSWRTSIDGMYKSRQRDEARLAKENRLDGIGPADTAYNTLLTEGKDPFKELEAGARERARTATNKRVDTDTATLGGSSTEEYTFEDFARDLGDSNTEMWKDPDIFKRRYGKFMDGAKTGAKDAVIDLAKLAAEAGDTAGEAFESGLSDVTGYEFNAFGRENLTALNKAHDYLSKADALKIGEDIGKLSKVAVRRLEQTAAQGEKGVEKALYGAGYATSTILGAEEVAVAAVLKAGKTARNVAEIVSEVSKIRAAKKATRATNAGTDTTRVATATSDANKTVDAGGDVVRTANAGTPTPVATPEITSTTPRTTEATPAKSATPTPESTLAPEGTVNPPLENLKTNTPQPLETGPDVAKAEVRTPTDTPKDIPATQTPTKKNKGMAGALDQPTTTPNTPDVTPDAPRQNEVDTPTLIVDTPKTAKSTPDTPNDVVDTPTLITDPPVGTTPVPNSNTSARANDFGANSTTPKSTPSTPAHTTSTPRQNNSPVAAAPATKPNAPARANYFGANPTPARTANATPNAPNSPVDTPTLITNPPAATTPNTPAQPNGFGTNPGPARVANATPNTPAPSPNAPAQPNGFGANPGPAPVASASNAPAQPNGFGSSPGPVRVANAPASPTPKLKPNAHASPDLPEIVPNAPRNPLDETAILSNPLKAAPETPLRTVPDTPAKQSERLRGVIENSSLTPQQKGLFDDVARTHTPEDAAAKAVVDGELPAEALLREGVLSPDSLRKAIEKHLAASTDYTKAEAAIWADRATGGVRDTLNRAGMTDGAAKLFEDKIPKFGRDHAAAAGAWNNDIPPNKLIESGKFTEDGLRKGLDNYLKTERGITDAAKRQRLVDDFMLPVTDRAPRPVPDGARIPDGAERVNVPVRDEYGRSANLEMEAEPLAEGAFNEIYRLGPPNEGKVARTPKADADPDGIIVDEFGRKALEDPNIDNAKVRALPREVVKGPDGKKYEILPFEPRTAKSQLAENPGGKPTEGQAIAFDKATRELNNKGYVWLDNHSKNYFFEPIPDAKDEWRVVVVDTGGIVRAKSGAADAAHAAQAAINNPTPEFMGKLADNIEKNTGEGALLFMNIKESAEIFGRIENQLDLSFDGAKGAASALQFRADGVAQFPRIQQLFSATDPEAAYQALRAAKTVAQ